MRTGAGATTAGFVLAGGGSSRMGRDKALLEIGGEPILLRIARAVAEAAGSVVIVGEPERYARFGFPVLPDGVRGIGPLGGLLRVLESGIADWSLVVACDMPGVTTGLLKQILAQAQDAVDARCAAAVSGGEPEPLCAVYHRSCLPEVRSAVEDRRLRMRDLLARLEPIKVAVGDIHLLENINTPAEWLAWRSPQG